MSSPTTTDNLYASFSSVVNDVNVTKQRFIQILNRLLSRMNITKPAEQITEIFYLKDYEKYAIPQNGFKNAIALYAKDQKIIFYVSPFRYRLKDPLYSFTDQADNGKRYLKIQYDGTSSQVSKVTTCDSLTDDGAWSISGGANLSIDSVSEPNGEKKIAFEVNSAQPILTFIRSSAIDGSGFSSQMRERFNLWIPQTTYLTNAKIRIGNDASNYYEITVTSQADLEVFTNTDRNELEFAQENSTMTGSVDKSNLVWFQFEMNFSQAVNLAEFAINKIGVGRPEKLELEWYTNYLGFNANGELIQSLDESDDSTDEPIVKDYPDYLSTILDGSIYEYLSIPDPTRAATYYSRYIGEKDPSGVYINGLGLLKTQYPSRCAQYKRIKTLPDLNYNIGGQIFTNDKS